MVSERDLDSLLRQVLEAARDLTSARYAALGVLDSSQEELVRFLTLGVADEVRDAGGAPPEVRSVLGELIRDPKPSRRDAFLGVPIIVRGAAFGSLYLADKSRGGEFTGADEQAVATLTDFAALAIDNANLYAKLEDRHSELERMAEGLAANVELARTVEGETDSKKLLELIGKRGQALVEARTFVVLMPREGRLAVVEAAGDRASELRLVSVSMEDLLVADVFREGGTQRVPDLESGITTGLGELATGARTAMLAALIFHGRPQGVLVALDHSGGDRGFDHEAEVVLESFAASAGAALARAQMVEAEKLDLSIEAAERERRRWARELHDETLQELGALKMMLELAIRGGDPELALKTISEAVEHVARGIDNLKGLITDLRPAALDELGLGAALDVLMDRVTVTSGLEIDARVELAYETGRVATRLPDGLEDTIYRLVQEAVNNVVKHADADRIRVEVREREGWITVLVEDDGKGFEPGVGGRGFGLVGMRERVGGADGRLEIAARTGQGTTVQAELPVRRQSDSHRAAD